ncbi:ribonucleoside-diphosphate reductase subunit alpha [Rickettsiales endosymbiont of Stachyamoeba lipophora]|uniref:ribonucleoside-diphosphate reductase subunit alpha n=1 Tax=Rickettsiales endosymbiont of Stachyamoeba lipophora TaxID=2486578 RepID=UPI000F64FBF4|nr:ribonucleoside-diphosphate reductase subunit alpha [Rickettsiales endosymbiont of Stachyamoeba lipophora]AZL16135.1 ribonucleoside-diphosphate reductase subunit alpha [Rickettsiales endosymbiont of Stachyamoeba lipophora]
MSYNIQIDNLNDARLTDFGKAVLTDRYLIKDETYQDLFARVAIHFADNQEHATRLYGYMGKLWFMPATPVLSNGGTKRGLPISCYLNEAQDSLKGIVDLWTENVWLAARGGGIGSYWGNIRSIGEKVSGNGQTSGVVPFLKVQDSMTLAISQGSLRRGSSAVYLPINHPEIKEFINLRRPTGGDPNRKALNIHHGVVITDDFMAQVENDGMWDLISPHNNQVVSTVKARDLWADILTTRIETGEPYVLFIDTVNDAVPEHHKKLGLNVKTSNLCSEITLPTGVDHLGNDRTAVCCLSSLNLEYYEEWCDNKDFIPDIMRFLDNVLEDFIQNAPESMARAKYSAMRERSVGLGVMGFHSFLQSKLIPFESVIAKVWNTKMFKLIKEQVDQVSKDLALERGPCPDAAECGIMERFTNKMAIAPTASISIIAGNASPGIEPYAANSFSQKTLSGTFTVRNKHLAKLLEEKDENNEDSWSSISTHEGSVQHLDFLTQDEKDVFKTAFELDQRWVIEHAADRTPYVCQAQSLNLFFKGDVAKKDLHQVHFAAWKKKVKSMYYLRSTSIQRADKVSHKVDVIDIKQQLESSEQANTEANSNNYEECLACQ